MDTKILIGVPTAENARRADFYDYLHILERPGDTFTMMAHGQSPARNRNLIIQCALENDCTHILFLDDDVAFQPTLLKNLLKHDKDIVVGLQLMRNYPHHPIIFDFVMQDGKCGFHFLKNGETGLIPIVAAGLGCALINCRVFRAMESPWITLGEFEKDHWCDDISFFHRARKLGFTAFCDLDIPIGHMAHVTLWPDNQNGKWMTVYDTFGPERVAIPAVQVTTEEDKVRQEEFKKLATEMVNA